ncbi:MAG TPA: peptide deformylase [Patescibacteria group bacterium]|nr:peptide deformylase [Patescibacteria group bacterium]
MGTNRRLPAFLPPDQYDLTDADRARFIEERQRGMLPPDSPELSKAVAPLPVDAIKTPRIQQVIASLFTAANGQRRDTLNGKKKRTLVGLAAPQIGERYRVILVDTRVDESRKEYGNLECLINPEIIWRTRETIEGREGCFSAGPVWGLVRRPAAIKVRAYTKDGVQVERILEGFTARIACHEIDHLDGIRFPERIKNDRKRHWVHTEELGDYPDYIKHWPRLCTKERWEAYKIAGNDASLRATPRA